MHKRRWLLAAILVCAASSTLAQDEPPPDDTGDDTSDPGGDDSDNVVLDEDGNPVDNLVDEDIHIFRAVVYTDEGAWACEETGCRLLAPKQLDDPEVPGTRQLPDGDQLPKQIVGKTDPVEVNGEFVIRATDVRLPGFGVPWEFRRIYRSRVHYQSTLGFGWGHNYLQRVLTQLPNARLGCSDEATLISDNLEQVRFKATRASPDGTRVLYVADNDVPMTLEKDTSRPDPWMLDDGSGLRYYFDAQYGTLTRIADPAGNQLTFTWQRDQNVDQGGILTSVTDTAKRTIYYKYQLFQPSEFIKQAWLQCITLEDKSCDQTKPLLSFQVQFAPDNETEFDLTTVRDANGNGPTYTYDYDPNRVSGYLPDPILATTCHNLCDHAQPGDTSCENYDVCGRLKDDALNAACDFANGEIKPTLKKDGSIETTSDALDHFQCYCSGGPGPDTDRIVDPMRQYPGIDYCLAACMQHVSNCYSSNVFPECDDYIKGIQKFKTPVPFDYAACGCALGENLEFCNYSPTTPGCAAFQSEAAGLGLPADYFHQYSVDCFSTLTPKVDAQLTNCSADCYQSCVLSAGAADPIGLRHYVFGKPEDLNHNLLTVRDGGGRLVVENSYGTDVNDLSFDRVQTHEMGDTAADNTVTLEYHDLKLEQQFLDGKLPPLEGNSILGIPIGGFIADPSRQYTFNLDPQHVINLAAFDSLDVCPASCDHPTAVRTDDGLRPLRRTSPDDRAQLLGPDTALFRHLAGNNFKLIPPSARRARPGDVRWHIANVGFLATKDPAQFTLVGSYAAINRLFGRAGQTEIDLRTQTQLRSPNTIVRSSQNVWRWIWKFVGLERVIDVDVRGALARAFFIIFSRTPIGPIARFLPQEAPPPPPPGLAGTLTAQGLTLQSGTVRLTRTSARSARIRLPDSGAPVDSLQVGKASVTLVATREPLVFAVRGPARVVEDLGRQQQVQLFGDARGHLKLGSAKVPAPAPEAGTFCRHWTYGSAKRNPAAQIPAYAVVVHELHEVVRTNYYDASWHILRSVNLNNKETTNYTYSAGLLQGFMPPTGERVCRSADGFDHTVQLTRLPSTGFRNLATAEESQYQYDKNGQLTDIVVDPSSNVPEHVQLHRDDWSRISSIERAVDDKNTESIVLGYDTTPDVDPHAIVPSSITYPNGSVTTLGNLDPGGAGPRLVTLDAHGPDSRAIEMAFDSLGNQTLRGRINHPASYLGASFDPAGEVQTTNVANLQNPASQLQTTYTWNLSRQVDTMSDPNVEHHYDFNALGSLEVAIDAPRDAGKTQRKSTCYMRDADGRLEFVILPEGNVEVYHYDDGGRLTSIEKGYPSFLGQYIGQCLHRPEAEIAADLRAVLLAAESFLRRMSPLRSRLDPPKELAKGGLIKSLDSSWQKIKRRPNWELPDWPSSRPAGDPGMETVLQQSFAPGGLPFKQTDGTGVGAYLNVDGFGRVVDVMDRPNTAGPQNHHRYGYDARNRVIWEAIYDPIAPGNDSKSKRLAEYHKPAGIEPSLRAMTEYEYDNLNRATAVKRWLFANGKAVRPGKLIVPTTITYDDADSNVSVSVDGDPPTTYHYDALGRLRATTLPDSTRITSDWTDKLADGDLRVTTYHAHGQSNVRNESIDDQGHVTATRDEQNVELAKNEYDSFGRLSARTLWGTNRTELTWDAFDRVLTETSKAAIGAPSIAYDWDRDDRLRGTTAANAGGTNLKTVRTLDGLGRVMAVTDPANAVRKQTWYPGSRRAAVLTDQAGDTITYDYDVAGNLWTQTVAAVSTSNVDQTLFLRTYAFDSLGMTSASVSAFNGSLINQGMSVSFTRDSFGRVISEKNNQLPISLTQSFDTHLIAETTAAGNQSARVERTLDVNGRIDTVRLNGGQLAKLTYDGAGQPSKISYGADGSLVATPGYDRLDRPTGLSVQRGDSVLAYQKELLGADGIPRVIERGFGQTISSDVFQVDEIGRVTGEGNRIKGATQLSGTPTNADVDPLLKTGERWRTYAYDSSNNWTAVNAESGSLGFSGLNAVNQYGSALGANVGYDSVGNLRSVQQNQYTYNALGQLTTAQVNGQSLTYAYDALGRRVMERDKSGATTYFVWRGTELAAVGTNATDGSGYSLRVPGGGIDSHLATADSLGSGAVRYHHQGPDGSVFALTDGTALTQGFLYTAFGETTTSDAQPPATRLLFQGHVYDPALLAYSMRAREYAPALGRFFSPDPIGIRGGNNLYSFVQGRALNFVDPFGFAGADQRAYMQAISWAEQPEGFLANTYTQFFNTAFDDRYSATDRVVAGVGALLYAGPAGLEEIARGFLNTPHTLAASVGEVYYGLKGWDSNWGWDVKLERGSQIVGGASQAVLAGVGLVGVGGVASRGLRSIATELSTLVEDAGGQGVIDYGSLDTLGRPQGIRAVITEDLLGTGTKANPAIEPPGWGGDGEALNQARGHLLGCQLGGCGDIPENLITITQNPTNTPIMRGLENQVRAAVEAGQTVEYTVTPIYDGPALVPHEIEITARGSGGFTLDVKLANPAAAQ